MPGRFLPTCSAVASTRTQPPVMKSSLPVSQRGVAWIVTVVENDQSVGDDRVLLSPLLSCEVPFSLTLVQWPD